MAYPKKHMICLLKMVLGNDDVTPLLEEGYKFHEISFMMDEARNSGFILEDGSDHLQLTEAGRQYARLK